MAVTTREASERKMINLAIERAEEMLQRPDCPPSIVQHYLRLAASDFPLRKERLQRQNELYFAKKQAIEQQERSEQIAKDAVEAMMRYSGNYGMEEVADEMLQ